MTPASPDIHDLTGAYVLDSLPADEHDEFERHLSTCASCADEVREVHAVTTQLGLAVAVAPSPALRDRVLTAVISPHHTT